ncbi:MAG TPA: IPTL-CTERM sorting domain-containing protein [Thermoanaerobaculia bacterium]|nr:IPTL-CTERM sorting domain-containing protein [Thermoanaerobaculia bacterium]
MSVTVSDSPDPVMRDGNITYTVQVANAGPNAATNATMSVYNSTGLGFVSVTEPAGWTCTEPAAGQFVQFSCTNPSLAAGATSTFTLVVTTNNDYYGNVEGTINTVFSAGSSTTDPNNGNNMVQASTTYVVPDADMSVTVTDSPDPVFPDGQITYTAQVANAGPDPAVDAQFAVYNSSGLGFVSVTAPAGWTCTPPAPGAFLQFSCTNPSFAVGATGTFTVVATTDTDYYGSNDGTINTSFSVGSGQSDPNNGNNVEQETTAYVAPDSDLSVTATDSPDPVTRGGNITYTVTLGNAGPDTAAASVTVPMTNGLTFVSQTVPAGFVCTGVPAPGTAATYSCTDTTFAPGDTAVFTIVLNVDPNSFGPHDGTITEPFAVTSSIRDPNGDNNIAVVATAYDPPTSNLNVTATDTPDPVNAGSNLTYNGTVTNAGPDAATNTTLTVALSSSVFLQSFTAPTGFTCTTPAVGSTGVITCTNASFASGANLPFTIVTQVNPALASGPEGFIQTDFEIHSDNGDPALPNEVDVITQFLTPDADLSATNTDTPDPVAPGGTITYTQTITNNGPDAATNVTFSEVLPASVGFVSITQTTGPVFSCTTPAAGASGLINCTAPTLASGTTASFTVVVDVVATSGTIGNTVTVDSATFDPDGNDDTATASTTILADAAADLSITKSTTATSAAPGSNVQYTIVVTNNGPDAASTIVLTDTLPAELQFVSITAPAGFTCTTPAVNTSGTITCNGATLANGASATFTLNTRIAPDATGGNVANSATVTSATGDPDNGDTTGTSGPVLIAPASADLSIVKNTASATAQAGSTFSYTIQVANAGPDAATNVVVTDVLPAQLQFQSITTPAGFSCTTPAAGANGTITCTAATLASGATATFTLNVRVASNATAGTVTNNVTVTSNTADPDGDDTTDAAPPVTLVPATADLSITKTTASTTATTGGTLTYTITVANAGPSAATGVVVSDTLPAGTQFVSATPSQGTCTGTTTVTCNLGTINNGANATITLQTLVTATSGTISNTATVTSPVTDPDEGDQAATTPPIPVGGPSDIAAVPTLSEWALIALAAMLGMLALLKIRL